LQVLGRKFQRACAAAGACEEGGGEVQGKAREAARLAKRILWVSRAQGEEERQKKASVSGAVSAFFDAHENETLAHLENIQAQVARSVNGNKAVKRAFENFGTLPAGNEQRGHSGHEWSAEEARENGDGRGEELSAILRALHGVSTLFERVHEIVQQGDPLVQRVEDRVNETAAQVTAAEREIISHYAVNGASRGSACSGLACAKTAILAFFFSVFFFISSQ